MKRKGKAPRSGPPKPNRPPSAPDTIDLTIVDMAHGGRAIARYKGKMVFIPYAIPGEKIKARLRGSGKIITAEGLHLVEASADRVFPRCQHFGPGRCWGCQWQHIDYPAQLLLKHDVIADQLSRLGEFSDQEIEKALRPVIASPQQWNYHSQMLLEKGPDGRFGFFQADGKQIEPISLCHIVHPDLFDLYETLDLDFAGAGRLKFQLGTSGPPMLTLFLKDEDPPELKADFPASVNVVLPDNEPVNLIGDSFIINEVAGRRFRVTAGAFIRSNIAQIEPLVHAVASCLRGDEAVLDLYGGVGIFSAFIAAQSSLITLVESYPPAVTDAEENLREFAHIDLIEGTVEEVLSAMVEEEALYDAAIVDPPASGMSAEAIRHLLALNLKRIVYVSSDPASLARNGGQFAAQGYRLISVQPFDFAPQTYYVECVALFERA